MGLNSAYSCAWIPDFRVTKISFRLSRFPSRKYPILGRNQLAGQRWSRVPLTTQEHIEGGYVRNHQ
jgi:hypothetical protein